MVSHLIPNGAFRVISLSATREIFPSENPISESNSIFSPIISPWSSETRPTHSPSLPEGSASVILNSAFSKEKAPGKLPSLILGMGTLRFIPLKLSFPFDFLLNMFVPMTPVKGIALFGLRPMNFINLPMVLEPLRSSSANKLIFSLSVNPFS